ncbi:hypothetical protein [Providencia rettgeri]|jgi:type 1 fimbria pilin|uniref:hypothetical protein n=1 Tax=Providencia rettgeri TaxID=587 RepID=UPI00235E3AED|nr:hypothetical protein [Providencia rettgeri]MDR2224540.1 hypothetical protein [Providencia sp.]
MKKLLTRKVFNHSLTALLLISASSAFNVYAAQDQASGAVHFSGAIVHPTCTNNVTEANVELSCFDDKTNVTTSNIDLKNIHSVKGWNVINDGRNELSYNWVNKEEQLGMLTIKYI